MNRLIAVLILTFICGSASAQENEPVRPRITGIGRVTIYVRDRDQSAEFYSKILGYHSGPNVPCETTPHICFAADSAQIIDVVSLSSPAEGHNLGEIGFKVIGLEQMRRFLLSRHVSVSEIFRIKEEGAHYGLDYFTATDPDGHPVGFLEFGGCVVCEGSDDRPVSSHIIHAGFVVRDRAAEEQFYKEILGFRPYWHGGMKEDRDDWVSLQVPDGRDWLEFMVSVSPNADHHTLGVMNHIALGVRDIHAARQQLVKNGWRPGEEPKIGRDGKWQLNVYDPDQTRIEFMEFKPVQKPCCSEFTGRHPEPN